MANNPFLRSIYSLFNTFTYLFPFVWNQDRNIRCYFLFSVILILFSVGLNIGTPFIFKYVVTLIDSIKSASVSNQVICVLLGYGFAWMLAGMVLQIREIVAFPVMERAITTLSMKVFTHLHTLSSDYHNERKLGSIIAAIEKAQIGLPETLWWLLFHILPTFLELSIAFSIIGYRYGWLYLLFFITLIGVYLIIVMSLTSRANKLQFESNKVHAGASAWIVDSLLNYENVRLFKGIDAEIAQCKEWLYKRELLMVRSRMARESIGFIQSVMLGFGLIVAMLISGYQVLKHHMDLSDLILVHTYVVQLSFPLNNLGMAIRRIRQGLINIRLVQDILDQKPSIIDSLHAQDILLTAGSIHFDHLYFAYPGTSISALNNVTIDIPAKSFTAIVGKTGAGKTTLVKLLLRFYDPTQGTITIDGYDLKEISLASLYRAISIIPQDVALFNHSLRYNLTFGNQEITESELQKALDLASLHEWVAQLPIGLDTLIGEKGVKISGGEKQRLSIARALLRRSSIIIFDEPTASLDGVTEQKIKALFTNHLLGCTRIVIAHRLSTIQNADRIIVMDQGRMSEVGTHQELIHRGGVYYHLCQQQLKST